MQPEIRLQLREGAEESPLVRSSECLDELKTEPNTKSLPTVAALPKKNGLIPPLLNIALAVMKKFSCSVPQ